MKIFITRIIPDRGLALVKEHFPTCDIWSADLPPAREELLQRARGVDGLLCLLTEKIDAELMDAAGSQLKVISWSNDEKYIYFTAQSNGGQPIYRVDLSSGWTIYPPLSTLKDKDR